MHRWQPRGQGGTMRRRTGGGDPMGDGPEPVDAERLPTGTVTFLLCDVEGSTALWESDPAAMAEAMARHEAILADAIAGMVAPARWSRARATTRWRRSAARSDAAQRGARRASRAAGVTHGPMGATIRVRMGLHTGEAHLVDGATYAGRDLNRCARIRNLARGGQIYLSRTTHDLLVAHPPAEVTFRDIGSHQMKGIERPERVYQLCHPQLDDGNPAVHEPAGHADEPPGQPHRPDRPRRRPGLAARARRRGPADHDHRLRGRGQDPPRPRRWPTHAWPPTPTGCGGSISPR